MSRVPSRKMGRPASTQSDKIRLPKEMAKASSAGGLFSESFKAEQGGIHLMKENGSKWQIGDACFMVVSVQKKYVQDFTVQGMDGRYYIVKRGNYRYRAAPERLFRTKDEAQAYLEEKRQSKDTRNVADR